MQSQKLDGLKITSHITLLEPGMYIFHYAFQPIAERSVCTALQQAPLGKGVIDFSPAESVNKNMLTKLGDCIIGRVKGGVATVLITEYYLAEMEIDSVDLRIDRIDTSTAIMRNVFSVQPAPESVSLSKTGPVNAMLKLTGHLQSAGDVSVTDRWQGEESSTQRLEGFSITWDNKPEGVVLAYTSTTAGAGPSQKVLTDSFTGAYNNEASLVPVGFTVPVKPARVVRPCFF